MNRPATFGRRAPTLTRQQRNARAAACWLFALFAAAIMAGLNLPMGDGGRVLLVVLAFAALAAGMAAANEA